MDARLLILVMGTLAIGVCMLYFGIRLKGYRPVNNVHWLPQDGGISFKRFAIAYTNDFFPRTDLAINQNSGLTIELAFKAGAFDAGSFRHVLSVNDGNDARQLLIGQWRHWLIIMNGNDYDGSQGTIKVSVDVQSAGEAPHLLSINSATGGTDVFLDGRLVKSSSNLTLFYPDHSGDARLVVGNGSSGRHPWDGALYGLALYDAALGKKEIRAHYDQWSASSKRFAFKGDRPAQILYRFDGSPEEVVHNQTGDRYHLNIPEYFRILNKEVLGWPRISRQLHGKLARDMVINFFGFLPLGIMLCATLHRIKGMVGRHALWIAVGLAFAFSLAFEVFQVWIPSRDSSMLDLSLNTLGAWTGAWAYMFFRSKLYYHPV